MPAHLGRQAGGITEALRLRGVVDAVTHGERRDPVVLLLVEVGDPREGRGSAGSCAAGLGELELERVAPAPVAAVPGVIRNVGDLGVGAAVTGVRSVP